MKKTFIILILFLMCILALPLSAQEEVYEEAQVIAEAEPDTETDILAKGESSSTVTLELKNMDIVEILKLLASKSGRDIVISQNVRGRITLFMEDVPVWDAMQIVFETAELAYTEHQGILRIVTEREYEQQFGRKFHDNREVKIIQLDCAQATDVVTELRQLKSRIGNVLTDDRTNSVILLDTPGSIKIMEETLRELDVPAKTKIFTLRYTPAKSLEETLKKVITKKGTLHVDDLTNKIILTDIPDVIRQADLLVLEYDKPAYLETRIFSLNYGKFDDIEKKIKDMLTKDVGIIQSDERTNKIVVVDLPEKILEISKLVYAYDEPSRQVLIEAKVVQVALKDEYKMGINWQLVLNSVWVDRLFNTDTIDMALSQVFESLSEVGTSDSAFDNAIRSTHPGARTLITGTLKEGHDFDTIIDALKTAGKTNLLSSPRILALNNEEARIQVGTREAFVTNTVVQSTSAPTTTAENVTFIDVGILLTVTPIIGEDRFIRLKIKPEVSNVERTITTAQGNQIPIVATQEAETVIMAKDGTTIIIGGLIQDQQYKSTDKIPILGSLPILGIPFRKESNKIQKNELVIFLTPHIVTGDLDLSTPSPKMVEYLENLKQQEKQAADDVDFKMQPVKEKVERKQLFTPLRSGGSRRKKLKSH